MYNGQSGKLSGPFILYCTIIIIAIIWQKCELYIYVIKLVKFSSAKDVIVEDALLGDKNFPKPRPENQDFRFSNSIL